MIARVILFGTPLFSLPTAEALLLCPESELVAVVCAPDAPVGRGRHLAIPELKAWAIKNEIPYLQPRVLDNKFIKELSAFEPMMGIIASYGKIIPKQILDIFQKGIINIHPSLLPRHRGAAPIQATILAGDVATGITLMLTDEEMDHGPIIAQKHFPLWPNESTKELKMRMAEHGAKFLIEILPKWLAGEITPSEQAHKCATVSNVLTRSDGQINWTDTVTLIERKLRAYDPWPGIFTNLPNGKRLKVLFLEVVEGVSVETGTIAEADDKTPMIRATDGWIKLVRVQPEGKNPMDGVSFLNGHRNLIGKRLS